MTILGLWSKLKYRIYSFVQNLLGGLTQEDSDPDPIASLEVSCVVHYKMNDNAASTVVVDSKGLSNGTARQNTSILHTIGKIGGALKFNGTNDYITIPNQAALNFGISDFSICFGCKDIFGKSGYVLYKQHPTQYMGYNIYIEDADISIGCIGQDYSTYMIGWTPFPINLTGWHFYCFVKTQSSFAIYEDRISKNVNMEIVGTLTSTNNLENLLVGTYGIGSFLKGNLDNIMVFNRALNSEEIAILYNSGRGTEDFQLSPQLDLSGAEILMGV